MTTYTRLEAAQQFGVSNTIISRNLKALSEMGFAALTTDENRLTERAIYLIDLYRAKDFSMLDDELEADRLALDPLQSDVCDIDIEPSPTGYALAPIQSSQYSIAPVATFSAAAYEKQADSALSQWQSLQNEMNARAAQMQANNEQIQAATQATARNLAAQMLMGMSAELSQQLAAGMPIVQAQALQMMMGKPAAAPAPSRS
ncbi:MAG: hypothetical protein HC795_12995 [Coleofasciculaceae cyanobacterium RL_1_1]|nr:hypothetical protein [Coleofasciculaceae cyanobacterium RL_1_1]